MGFINVDMPNLAKEQDLRKQVCFINVDTQNLADEQACRKEI